ncbi:sugar kinase [Thermoflexus sp.]|uniref:sugar kinase n=1 Tax=Thermoflexus sp. TaxID=1969742 RepID=UPI001790159E|nr:sugar kinase [Thermoflexus sp.]
MPDVVTIGETLLRLTAPPGFGLEQTEILRLEVAGAESNVAIGLSRLGISSGWISRLVNNPLGRRIVNKIREHGVDVSRVIWTSEGRVGLYYLELGQPPRPYQVIYDRAGSAFSQIDPEEVDWDYVHQARLIHLTGITPGLGSNCYRLICRAIREAQSAGLKISFDVNYRSKLWSPEDARQAIQPFLPAIDVLFCTLQEARQVLGWSGDPETMLREAAQRYPGMTIVLTLEEGGALLWYEGEIYKQPGYPLEPLDRVGAGDAMVAGFLTGFLQEDPLRGLAYGVAYAALKHTFIGDIAWCNRSDLEQLIRNQQTRWR